MAEGLNLPPLTPDPMKGALTTAALGLALSLTAQDLPQPSPSGKIEQKVGLTNVTIEYSRPSARGRKVFGDVVPFGQLWRTGANGSTKITFDGPVTIEGQEVKAGTYALLSIPGGKSWEIILNSDAKVNSATNYDEKLNVVKVTAEPTATGQAVETFTIGIGDLVKDGATVELTWENTRVAFRIDAPATEQGMKNIDKALAEKEPSANAYLGAARFCLERGLRTKEALTWAEKAAAMDGSKFWVQHTLALAYAANGDKANAVKTAKVSLEQAKEAKADAYVKMNEEKIAEWSK